MTTQDTQQDHSDVDATVVEHPFAPEASVDSNASETTIQTETEEQASTSSNEPVASAAASELNEGSVEASDEAAVPPSSEQPQAPVAATNGEEEESAPLVPAPVNEEVSTSEVSVSEPAKGRVEFPYRDVLSFAKEGEKEVRPFTAFIEEFRLAEEQARRQVTLPEAPVEALNLLTPAANDFSVPTQDEAAVQETTAPAEEVTAPIEEITAVDVQQSPIVETTEVSEPVVEVNAEEAASSQEKLAELVVSLEAEAGSAQKQASQVEPEKDEAISSESLVVEKSVPTPPPERAVSPLLRPASRVRTPRHARHLREEAAVEPASRPEEVHIPITAPAQGEQLVASGSAAQAPGVEKSKIERPEAEKLEQPTSVEPPAPPRPARRYRFDRPATVNNKATAGSSARVEENKEALSRTLSTARAETGIGASEQPVEGTTKTVSGALPVEQPVSKQQIQESSAQETPSVVTPAAPEAGRRRGHDRQKETSVPAPATPVVEPVKPVVEPASMQIEEIAPEDLPPLEYAELQKTTTRRRRRHRSSSSNGSSPAAEATATPVAPPSSAANANANSVVPPAAPGASPSAPAASRQPAGGAANGSSNYSIVSGYTVSQMNQGNDLSGPFMGPDPSPARGSVTSRDGRTTNRAEAHRTPTPLYPGRTHTQEGGLTTAAFNQLTNSLVQSLQNQTDRMVAELRRSNAAPTNVSVSLPPFPSTERVGVFVDVANLLYSARTLRMSVDFGKLLDFLRGNRRLVRAHAYCPTSPQAGDEQMFLQAVKGLGYRITTKNYKTFSSGAKKADLDLDLCMDVVRLVDGRAVDCVVLVSGDSDFMPMLDYCSDHGVRVEVAAFDEAMSATLRQSCDLFINLSMLEEIRS